MRNRRTIRQARQRGFSLIELMIVLLILTIMMGAIFQQINLVQQRNTSEAAKLDMFQQTREFMDQMARDLRQAGYPSPRNFNRGYLTAIPMANDYHAAVGLVKVASGDLWFEGDVDGTGNVSVVHYHLDTSTTGGCPCLRRSQQQKITADPVTGQTTPVYQVEVQNVQNTDIFSAFLRGSTGTPVTLPVDFDANPTTMAAIDTVKVVLTVQSKIADPKTGQRPYATLVSTVRLNNCSQAISGYYMSCR